MTFYSIKVGKNKDFPDKNNLLIRLTHREYNMEQSLKEIGVKEEYLDELKEIFEKIMTYDEQLEAGILEEINRSNIENVIFIGEPFSIYNRDDVSNLITVIKETFPQINIYLYTEHTFNHLAMDSLKTKLDEDSIGNILYTADGIFDGLLYPDATTKPIHYLDLAKTLSQAEIVRG